MVALYFVVLGALGLGSSVCISQGSGLRGYLSWLVSDHSRGLKLFPARLEKLFRLHEWGLGFRVQEFHVKGGLNVVGGQGVGMIKGLRCELILKNSLFRLEAHHLRDEGAITKGSTRERDRSGGPEGLQLLRPALQVFTSLVENVWSVTFTEGLQLLGPALQAECFFHHRDHSRTQPFLRAKKSTSEIPRILNPVTWCIRPRP